MSNVISAFEKKAQIIMKNLEKRNMTAHYCANCEDLVSQITTLLPDGCSIAWGGSESLTESGVMSALENNQTYQLIDRMKAKTPEERRKVYAESVMSDYYFMSTNAITLEGELVNIDGNGNRVACLIQGPEHVFIIAGMNKVVTDIGAGIERTRNVAAPPNCIRLNRQTPCAATGICGDCLSPDGICSHLVITRRSGHTGRIHVFLVAENLGY